MPVVPARFRECIAIVGARASGVCLVGSELVMFTQLIGVTDVVRVEGKAGAWAQLAPSHSRTLSER
jgi:hypothetical protein